MEILKSLEKRKNEIKHYFNVDESIKWKRQNSTNGKMRKRTSNKRNLFIHCDVLHFFFRCVCVHARTKSSAESLTFRSDFISQCVDSVENAIVYYHFMRTQKERVGSSAKSQCLTQARVSSAFK